MADRFRNAPLLLTLAALVLTLPGTSEAGRRRGGSGAPLEATGFQLFTSPQSNPIALSEDGTELYVANTTSNTVDVIDTGSNTVTASVRVGIDPVSVAVRPGTSEVWVSNHVSDSVSVIDTSLLPPQVVETIQAIRGDRVTDFDEPVGIAFTASGSKAYVALSSRNEIAVLDPAGGYAVTGTLPISAQEPRALAVRNGLLYVAAFESGNQTEASACADSGSAPQCTIFLSDFLTFGLSPNLPGFVKNIVVDPQLPDRDLFVFDTSDDSLVEAVTGVGTLLYGLAVDGSGKAWISQTFARNAVNGADGLNLIDLENRIFDNQLASVSCDASSCGNPAVIELEPALPLQPAVGDALATPYGIQVSDDGSTLVVTAAASSRIFTFDTTSTSLSGVLDRLDVGSIPRGVALRSDGAGAPQTAYVLNTLGNSVTVVDVSGPAAGHLDPSDILATIPVGDDPTANDVRLGRIAFNDADASTSGTFSCASCHPDGHNDQLLWRIGGACFFGDCTGDDEPRTTMPVRGLKNTLPLHWDGTLGDPFGGLNGAVSAPIAADCGDDQGCFRFLVNASLSGVMCDQDPSCATGPSGDAGLLTAAERDDMATFLQTTVYAPARSRRPDDVLTTSAADGFADFFLDQGGIGNQGGVTTCADASQGCHALPLGASTCTGNSKGVFTTCTVGAFDAPTMRGMTDRFVHFSLGFGGPEEILQSETSWTPAVGMDEFSSFNSIFPVGFTPAYNVGPLDLFQMFEEASTGFSGATGRQVTLNTATTAGCTPCEVDTILAELEAADAKGVVNLQGTGRRNANSNFNVEYNAGAGNYRNQGGATFSRSTLISEAQSGALLLTLTAELRANVGDLLQLPQPVLAPNVVKEDDSIPRVVQAGGSSVTVTAAGIDVRDNPQILVDGQLASGSVGCFNGSFNPFCSTGVVEITLSDGLAQGLHLVQVQNPKGLLSNELPVCAANNPGANDPGDPCE
jgi:YVTN family beta-propeller protein